MVRDLSKGGAQGGERVLCVFLVDEREVDRDLRWVVGDLSGASERRCRDFTRDRVSARIWEKSSFFWLVHFLFKESAKQLIIISLCAL